MSSKWSNSGWISFLELSVVSMGWTLLPFKYVSLCSKQFFAPALSLQDTAFSWVLPHFTSYSSLISLLSMSSIFKYIYIYISPLGCFISLFYFKFTLLNLPSIHTLSGWFYLLTLSQIPLKRRKDLGCLPCLLFT